MTTYNNNLKSLSILCNTTTEKILSFLGRSNNDITDFLLFFNLTDIKLSDIEIELVSIHSTTSSDNCYSIQEIGLLNLQSAITRNTSLHKYLNKKEIQINIEDRYIYFKNYKFDLNNNDSNEKNRIIYRLYDDYQINGFLHTHDLMSYGARPKYRPEFLWDLSNLLNDRSIENDWEKSDQNKHYIVKFKQPLDSHTWYTFDLVIEDEVNIFGFTENSIKQLTSNERQLIMRKWVLQTSLLILKDEISEKFSYICPSLDIEPQDIIDCIPEQDYLTNFTII